jgi:carboxymethylenebutenolidase
MCTEEQIAGMTPATGRVSRRQFTTMGAGLGIGGAIVACAPAGTAAQDTGRVMEHAVSFDAPGGTMDGVFLHPAEGRHPAIILWPDIAGVRPAKIEMGRRLAGAGYAVLVANPYYRSVAGQPFADFEAWREGGGMQAVGPWMQANTPDAIAETAGAVVAWLDSQEAVDTARGIGNQGYCMTGSWTIRTAAAVPDRVKAAASFHGGGLTGEGPAVPVNLFDDMADDARALIAIARNDDAQDPAAKDALRAAADAAGLEAEIEVYAGDHGWTVLDSPVYDAAEADRAWAKLLELYARL